MPVETAWICF